MKKNSIMYIKRIGKSLDSCSQGFFYKIINTDKTRFFIVDNNGANIPVRQNSKHWSLKCEVDMTRIGSKIDIGNHQTSKQTSQNTSQSSSSDDSLIHTAIAISLLT